MMSIRAKIIGGFLVVFGISIIIGIYCLNSINKIHRLSEEQAKYQEASTAISSVLEAHYGWRQSLTTAVFTNTEFTGSYDPTTCALGKWRNSDEAKGTANDEILSLLEQLDVPHNYIHTEAQLVMDLLKEGQQEEAEHIFMEEIMPSANSAISILGKMTEEYDGILTAKTEDINAYQQRTILVIIAMIVIATILSVSLAFFIIRGILRPVRSLAESADMVTKGNLSVNFKFGVNDEIGKLTKSFAALVDVFKNLISDLSEMAKNHALGNCGHFIDENRYQGEFQDVAIGINSMIKEYIDNMQDILQITQKYAEGDFSAKLHQLPGDKASANDTLDAVADNLKDVEKSVMFLVGSALEGQLDKRIDDSKFMGDWKGIVDGMNRLLEAVAAPLAESEEILELVSEGKLDVKVTGSYKGEFEKMTRSINKTIEILSEYISDISINLNELASDNFNVEVSRDYVGAFSDIKVSLNAIIRRLNNVMTEIGAASEQVASGAGQISKTSMLLSEGATEQAGSIQELSATIESIHDKSMENAQNSTTANELAVIAKNNAEQGNTEMKQMLSSMTEINEASGDISKVIKVIEDIAFQTNLLALNAAVEAARAGEHGKGFAVVADEVRNLAARSQSSVKETAVLIERSVEKVNEGTKIANETASALIKIVEGVENVSDIIGKIEISSKEQAASISQINEGIGQISQVTQSNSATSEESAAAAEQLNSQAELLKAMIAKFELKR